jgi:hypothetical protein
MTLILEGQLVGPTIALSVVYLALATYVAMRFVQLHRVNTEVINTRKLFVLNSLLVSVLRALTFFSVTVFNWLEFHTQIRTDFKQAAAAAAAAAEVDETLSTDAFFEKAVLVLFDLPAFCCLSGYVLLIVVCAEASMEARDHWLNPSSFRQGWLMGFLVFNALLYSVQVSLYSLLFVPQVDQELLATVLYACLSALNLGLPLLWLVGFVFGTLRFAGYPFVSMRARARLHALVQLSVVWTVARLCWGVVALTTVLQGWLARAQASQSHYAAVLVGVFLVAEVGPILYGLQPAMMDALGGSSSLPHGAGGSLQVLHKLAPM